MKTRADSFAKWLQGVVAMAFTAWLGWVSLALIGLQQDMRVVKYRLFGNAAVLKSKTEVQQAGAGIFPLPETRKNEPISNSTSTISQTNPK